MVGIATQEIDVAGASGLEEFINHLCPFGWACDGPTFPTALILAKTRMQEPNPIGKMFFLASGIQLKGLCALKSIVETFSNPQSNPQSVVSCTTSASFGSPRGSCKLL
jgi:hypothetical protein